MAANNPSMINFRNKQGSALVTVVIILMVVALLSSILLMISLDEKKSVIRQDNRMQAYYIARSGADTVGNWIIKNPASGNSLINKEAVNNSHFPNGDLDVQVDIGDNTGELRVSATGTVNGVENSVNLLLRQQSSESMMDKAIYCNGPLDITGMNVSGDVESGGNIQFSTNGSNTFHDKSYPNSLRYPRLTTFPDPPDHVPLSVTNPSFTVSGQSFTWDGNVSSGIEFGTIIVNNGTLTINPNGHILRLVVDKMTIDSDLNIDVSSGGRVELYVKSELTLTTKGTINNVEPFHLTIFLADNSTFYMQSNKVLNGYIIGPNATVQIQSAQSTTNGAIIANIVRKNSNGNGPNGAINYVPLPTGYDITQSLKAFSIVKWEK